MKRQRKRGLLHVILIVAGISVMLSSASASVSCPDNQSKSHYFVSPSVVTKAIVENPGKEADTTILAFNAIYYLPSDNNKKSQEDHCTLLSEGKCRKPGMSDTGSENSFPKSSHSRAFFCEYRT